MTELNAEAEAWLEEFGYAERWNLREAMRWAYADAARVCEAIANRQRGIDDGLSGAADNCTQAILARSGPVG